MKSLKESLGLSRTTSSIDGMPRSAVGILSHGDEEKLNKLWIDIIKAEEACQRLTSETAKYCSALKEVQSTEEKLLKLVGDSNIGLHSPELRQVVDEYLSVVVETKKISEGTSSTAHEVVGMTPAQYYALYEHLDAFRKKRDASVAEIERCQEKLDRLKLKGKRTTDVIVEKERHLRTLRESNSRLTNEAHCFHDSRVDFFRACVEASVHNQINYYGSVTSEFNKYVQLSRGAHQLKETEFSRAMDSHMGKIRALTIVDH